MKEIYRNDYGVTYSIENHPNPKNKIQVVIDNLGLFMSLKELHNFLNVVRNSYDISDGCDCENCGGKKFNKLWKSNELLEFSLKVDNDILVLLEDLLEGSMFILNIDAVLQEHRIN